MFALTVFPETVLMSGDSWSRIKGWVPERSSKKEGHPLCYKCDPVETSVAAGNVCSREIQPEKTCNNKNSPSPVLTLRAKSNIRTSKIQRKGARELSRFGPLFCPEIIICIFEIIH